MQKAIQLLEAELARERQEDVAVQLPEYQELIEEALASLREGNVTEQVIAMFIDLSAGTSDEVVAFAAELIVLRQHVPGCA